LLLKQKGFGTFDRGNSDFWPSDPKLKKGSFATQYGCVDQVWEW